MDGLDRKTMAGAAIMAALGAAISVGSIVMYNKLATDPSLSSAHRTVTQIHEPIPQPELKSWSSEQPRAPPVTKHNDIFLVCLTGGPCGGKTSCLQYLSKRLREDYGFQVFIAPEMPTVLASMCECPYPFASSGSHIMNWEGQKMRIKLEFEDSLRRVAASSGKKTVILCDRGVPDSAAYCEEDVFQDILDQQQWTLDQLYDRYDLVLHLESAAFDTKFYNTGNNMARRESVPEARTQDRKTQAAWAGHRNVKLIRNIECIVSKNEEDLYKQTPILKPRPSPPNPNPEKDLSGEKFSLDSSAEPTPTPTRALQKKEISNVPSSFQKKKSLVLMHVLELLGLEGGTTLIPRLFILKEHDKVSTANLEINLGETQLHRLQIETSFLALSDGHPMSESNSVVERRGTSGAWRYYLTKRRQVTVSSRVQTILTENRISGRQYKEFLARENRPVTVGRQRITFVVEMKDEAQHRSRSGSTASNESAEGGDDSEVIRSITHRIDKFSVYRKGEKKLSKGSGEASIILLSVDLPPSAHTRYTPLSYLGQVEEVTDRTQEYSLTHIAQRYGQSQREETENMKITTPPGNGLPPRP